MPNTEKRKAQWRAYYYRHREEALEYSRAYAESHRGQRQANAREWHLKNRERTKAHKDEYNRKYYAANREKLKAQQREYNAANKEQIANRGRAYHARLLQDSHAALRDQWRKTSAAYRDRHPDRRKAIDGKRRALRFGSVGSEAVDLKEIMRRSNGLCGICRKPLDLLGVEFDHIIPLKLGGKHTGENLQATHTRCNRMKGAKVI